MIWPQVTLEGSKTPITINPNRVIHFSETTNGKTQIVFSNEEYFTVLEDWVTVQGLIERALS